jgi:hypothetical protein
MGLPGFRTVASMEFLRRGLKRVRADVDIPEDDQEEAIRDAVSEGDILLEKIRTAMRRMGITPSAKQAEFQRGCIASLLPLLYGNEWDRNAAGILRRHNLENAEPVVAFIAARSDGKTIAASMVMAAFLHTCAHKRWIVALFAGYQRQTSAIIDRVYEFLLALPGGQEMTEKAKEALRIWPRGASHRNTPPTLLVATSNNAESARGLQPNVIMVDEAHFVANPSYFNVILPMAMANRRVLWLFSSPAPGRNVFELLTTAKDKRGNPIAVVTKTDACGCKGSCKHRLVRPLVHKTDRRKAEIMRVIYANNPDARARELQGMADRESTNVFDEDKVDFALRQHEPLSTPVPYVFVGVDPSGGGENSKTAWVIFTFQGEHVVVRVVLSRRRLLPVFQRGCVRLARARPCSTGPRSRIRRDTIRTSPRGTRWRAGSTAGCRPRRGRQSWPRRTRTRGAGRAAGT